MASSEPRAREWIVLLEAADERGRSTIDAPSFRRLVSSWPGPGPTALYSPNRYALQVPVRAFNPPSALSSAMWLWKDVLRRTGLPDWQLVRAEIVTPDELERELLTAEAAAAADAEEPLEDSSTDDEVAGELLWRALHDPLTGLSDRELFLDHVRRALAPRRDAAAPVLSVVVVDPGASLPAPAPDAVLVEVARRLVEAVRPEDTVARVGPRRFALLLTLPAPGDTGAVARRIADRIRAPLRHDGRTLALAAGIGVATTACSRDPDELMAMAEAAVSAPAP